MEEARIPLVKLTAGKAVANTALRWIPFFLPTLADAFDASTSRLTTVLGVGELSGLSTLLAGRHLDAGRERRIMAGGLGLVAVSATLALVGSLEVFAVSYVVLGIGVSLYTVGGHTYLSRRVPFHRRARSIGILETSWAFALLVGAPLVAMGIRLFGWRGPFAALAIAGALFAVVVARADDATVAMADASSPSQRQRLTADAWIVVAAAACIAVAGLTTVVIAGTWLSDALGVSTGGIGLVAMLFGAAELTASSGSATVADRAGPVASTRLALGALLVGLVIMTRADTSLAAGAAGLLVFFVGFEFAIVTAVSIVSEAMPAARGRTLAVSGAVATFARGAGVVVSGPLYDAYGIHGPASVSAAASVAAIVLLSVSSRRSARLR